MSAISIAPSRSVVRSQRASVDYSSALLSFAFCGLVVLGFILSSAAYTHWFVIPIYLSGGLIGIDAVSWLRGRLGVLDPFGLLGLLGLHFFFLAPLLHVRWNYWMQYVVPPEDWRPWLGRMAWINVCGLLFYFIARSTAARRPHRKVGRRNVVWHLDTVQLLPLLVPVLLLSFILQMMIYNYYGGIGGYIAEFESRLHGEATFEGLGWLFMVSETFPVLAIIGYAAYAQRTGRARSWAVIGLVLLMFFVLKVFFGGLRGSRANFVWPMFWSVGIIHLWVRSVSRAFILVSIGSLIFFMYAYGFYKLYGGDAVDVIRGAATENAQPADNREFERTILGDLGRSDVQAYLLYRLTSPQSDYHYSLGRTYIGAAALVVPAPVWPDRPPTKVKEGTQALYGNDRWGSGRLVATNAYGLAGETMLNFGPAPIPIAFAVFGIVIARIRQWSFDLRPDDSRNLLVPFILTLGFFLLVWDSDVTLYYIIVNGSIPFMIILLSSRKRNEKVVSGSSDSAHGVP